MEIGQQGEYFRFQCASIVLVLIVMVYQRKIIHVDMDCFYAAVEMRENPNLRGVPIAVGGSPDKRGVISTANYKARKFGVRSALSSVHAMRLCPKLIIVPGSHELYRQESIKIRDIFRYFAEDIEPSSLDEAFLDVSKCPEFKGSATLIAQKIRRLIEEETGLTASAGIAPNKFLAKVASDINKPNSQLTIAPDQIEGFLAKLPVGKIPGVGKVSNEKMRCLKIYNCSDLKRHKLIFLLKNFGKWGQRLYELARGQDNRPVCSNWIRKSLSIENTFEKDLPNLKECLLEIRLLFKQFLKRFEKTKEFYRVNSLCVKLKFNNFEQTTIERSQLKTPKLESYQELLKEAFERENLPVRLIGIGVGLEPKNAQNNKPQQLLLFKEFE